MTSVSITISTVAVVGQAGVLQLVLRNDSGAPLAVSANVTTLAIQFGDLVAPANIGGVGLSSPAGWTPQQLTSPPGLALVASADDTIPPGALRTFELSGITAAPPTRVCTLLVTHAHLGTLADETLVVPAVVQMTAPGQRLPVEVTVVPGRVTIQPADGPDPPIFSSLLLTMIYPSLGSGSLIVPDENLHPAFYLTAIYAEPPAAAAFTSPALASGLVATIDTEDFPGWSLAPQQSPGPRWMTTAVPNDVLAAGASVEIHLEQIVTDLAAGRTLLYLQYEQLNGYTDGYLTFAVDKVEPEPGFVELQAVTPLPMYGDGPFALTWRSYVSAGDSLELTFAENLTPRSLNTSSGMPFQATSFPASDRLVLSSDFTLSSYRDGQPLGRPASLHVEVIGPTTISDITIRPGTVPLTLAQPATLMWSTSMATSCIVSVDGFPGAVTIPVNADGPISTTLTLGGVEGAPTMTIGEFGTIDLFFGFPLLTVPVRIVATDGRTPSATATVSVPVIWDLTPQLTANLHADDNGLHSGTLTVNWAATGSALSVLVITYYTQIFLAPIPLVPPVHGSFSQHFSSYFPWLIECQYTVNCTSLQLANKTDSVSPTLT